MKILVSVRFDLSPRVLYYKRQVKLTVGNELTRATAGWLLAPGTISFRNVAVQIRNDHNFCSFCKYVSFVFFLDFPQRRLLPRIIAND